MKSFSSISVEWPHYGGLGKNEHLQAYNTKAQIKPLLLFYGMLSHVCECPTTSVGEGSDVYRKEMKS